MISGKVVRYNFAETPSIYRQTQTWQFTDDDLEESHCYFVMHVLVVLPCYGGPTSNMHSNGIPRMAQTHRSMCRGENII